ncbi:MAG TPA: hypothetical protein VK063_14040 [Beutenbergiaceae bacterium]|nr:hypothetical protein [Beutenbergiaceae bacterium]
MPAKPGRKHWYARAAVCSAVLAVSLTGCAGAERDRLEDEVAAASTDPERGAEHVILALTDVPHPGIFQFGLPDDDVIRQAAQVVSVDFDEVFAMSAHWMVGAGDPAWQEADYRDLESALDRLLIEPTARPPLARAVATWLDPRLPETPAEVSEQEPFDVEDARLLAGWRMLERWLPARQDDDVSHAWDRALALASLEVAEERARAETSDGDEPWALAIPAYRGSQLAAEEEFYESQETRTQSRRDDTPPSWPWETVVTEEILFARWLDQAPHDLAAMAVQEPPEWPGSAEVVELWREGAEVSDHPDAHAVRDALRAWLEEERLAEAYEESPLLRAREHVTAPLNPLSRTHDWRPPLFPEGEARQS